MGSSSFLNAFRLIVKKPALLLLLLPLQLAMPLVARFMPLATSGLLGDMSNTTDIMSSMMGFYGSLAGIIGLVLLLYILAGVFLIPPAMQALHEGAQDEPPTPGWYKRGIAKHWWKPVTLGAIEVGVTFVFYIIFAIILTIIMFSSGVMSGLQNGGAYTNTEAMASIAIPMLILMFVFFILVQLVISFFALMLPATADRSFGEAFKALFSGFGFKKVMKVFLVYLLTDIVRLLIIAVFGVAYMLLSGYITSPEELTISLTSFMGSWTYYCALALGAFTMLFKYGYVFSVFQEIKNREAPVVAPVVPLAVEPAAEGEGGVQ